MRVLVIQENTSFRAPNGAPELQHSVEYSFPTSVLASLPVEAEQDGTVLVDAESLLMRDAFDLLSQLRRPTRARGRRDHTRAIVASRGLAAGQGSQRNRSGTHREFSAQYGSGSAADFLHRFGERFEPARSALR